jgi:hypothetical protein
MAKRTSTNITPSTAFLTQLKPTHTRRLGPRSGGPSATPGALLGARRPGLGELVQWVGLGAMASGGPLGPVQLDHPLGVA